MHMTSPESIVEVSVSTATGSRAVGIMSMRQALDLPDIPNLIYTHPDPIMAAAGVELSRRDLERFMVRH